MNIEEFIELMEFIVDTKRKRHIVGGIFLSMSFFFGGLALTIMTINSKPYKEMEGNKDESENDCE